MIDQLFVLTDLNYAQSRRYQDIILVFPSPPRLLANVQDVASDASEQNRLDLFRGRGATLIGIGDAGARLQIY